MCRGGPSFGSKLFRDPRHRGKRGLVPLDGSPQDLKLGKESQKPWEVGRRRNPKQDGCCLLTCLSCISQTAQGTCFIPIQAWCRVSPSPDSPFLEGRTATVSSLHYKTGISRDSPKPGCTRTSDNHVQNYLSCQETSVPNLKCEFVPQTKLDKGARGPQ